jgi:uncharacterized membrane protein
MVHHPVSMPTETLTPQELARAALAGAATGLRSTVAVAALVETRAAGLPGPATGDRARIAAALGVAFELVVDKLPITPSRLAPRGLVGRVGFASAGGAVIARGAGGPVAPAVVLAAAAALAGAVAGHGVRAAAASAGLPDLPVALAEDTVALGLAAAAAR